MANKKFAKILESSEGAQVLVTNLYDGDEDHYVLTLTYESFAFGASCMIDNRMHFAEQAQSDEAFNKINKYEDVKDFLHVDKVAKTG